MTLIGNLWKYITCSDIPWKIINIRRYEMQRSSSGFIWTQNMNVAGMPFILSIISHHELDYEDNICQKKWDSMACNRATSLSDYFTLLSHIWNYMQDKLDILTGRSPRLGLKILKGEPKIMKINQENDKEKPLQEMKWYTYLSSNIDKVEGTDWDIKIRIQKGRRSCYDTIKFMDIKRYSRIIHKSRIKLRLLTSY